jgi:hypothetical protein
MGIEWYADFDEAARRSIHDKAVSETIELHLARYQYTVYGEIIMDIHHNAQCVWKSAPGLPIYDGSDKIKPCAHDIDQVKRWKPWGETREDAATRDHSRYGQ